MTKNKSQKGITLIALVVTIIVLLILAGISISMLTGQNGILNRAQEAKGKTETAQKDENQKLQGYEDIINKYRDLPKEEGTTPYLPNDMFSYEEGDLSTGLVIKDENNNEYVWVEVPKTTEVYTTAGLEITNFSDTEYEKIEEDLHTYTKDYRNETDYKDEYYQNDTEGWFTEKGETSYEIAKKKMLKSVYQNGGFWIGRYEAGIEKNRTEEGEATVLPLSKANLYPYTYVTNAQAKVLAEKVESGSYTSNIMFGVQWDLVLKYIETKKATTIENLNSDSTSIGNYYNSEFLLNRGEFAKNGSLSNWYRFDSEEKSDLVTGSKKKIQSSYENGILLTTGTTEKAKLQNIYDIAGNLWEWTLEKSSVENSPCTYRGGSYNVTGSVGPSNYRGYSNLHDSYCNIGFRISIY